MAKRGITTINAFKVILDASKRKLNKILADQAGEFYDIFFKKWLRDNHIKMYSTYSGGTSVVLEIFIRKTRFWSIWQLHQKIFILMF